MIIFDHICIFITRDVADESSVLPSESLTRRSSRIIIIFNMHMKPNKMKGVDRTITNPTSAWRVCYDLCSLGISWFGLHSTSY